MRDPRHHGYRFAYKILNAIARIPGMAHLMAYPRVQALREAVLAGYVAGLPDRRYWESDIMPALLGAGLERVLFVGCGSYTRHIPAAFEARGIACWTTDIDAGNAAWGNPHRHIVCDIADIADHVPAAHFDAVLFNGVMGYGVTGRLMETIAPVLHSILRPPGFLLIGWNHGLVEDPCTLDCITRLFSHGCTLGLPERREFPASTHVFDWFMKIASTADRPS
jgi:hypothetical protein